MNRRGVIYDVGTVYGAGAASISTRPNFDPATTRRELEIISTDLHCNAVRLRGRDVGRLMTAAKDALELGLEVWLSPEMWEKGQRETLGYIAAAGAAAERLRQQWPDRLVLSVASELTLFMRGIVPGRSVTKRLASLRRDFESGQYVQPLQAFLAEATDAVRGVFRGPVTYASLPFETVDWRLFDFVGVDHYRDARVKDRYVEMLRPFLAQGKPVVVTEFGMRGYAGAESSGALGFGVVDGRSLLLHHLPLVGRLVRPRLNGQYARDESLQAASWPRHSTSSMRLAPTARSSAASLIRWRRSARTRAMTSTCQPSAW